MCTCAAILLTSCSGHGPSTPSFDMGPVTRDTLEWLPEHEVWTMTITNVDLCVFGRTPRFPGVGLLALV